MCTGVARATTRSRQLLGINLPHDAGTQTFMSDHGRMHAQRQGGSATPETHGSAHLYPRVTSFRSRRAALTEAQQQVWDRLWPRLGTQARPGGLQPADAGIERLDT
jgi:tRNA (guanine-N7-)-methyltransferase